VAYLGGGRGDDGSSLSDFPGKKDY